jgi:hypothetical protein
MRFMMWVCVDESLVTGNDLTLVREWVAEMDKRGVRVEGHPLRPVTDATTLWPHNGGTRVQDGPFAETKERIAAFDILECADMAEAIEVAAKHPAASIGAVELRPVWE